jgi:hypothetical protein
MRDQRIPAEQVQSTFDVVFNKKRMNGSELAERLMISYPTLYGWYKDRGLPLSVAFDSATVMTAWAVELLEEASRLRRLAEEMILTAEREEAAERLAKLGGSDTWRTRYADALTDLPPDDEIEREAAEYAEQAGEG